MINNLLVTEGKIVASAANIGEYKNIEFTTSLYRIKSGDISNRIIELCISDGITITTKASTCINYKEKNDKNLSKIREALRFVIENSGVNIGDGNVIYINKYLHFIKKFFLENGESFLNHNIFLSHAELEDSVSSFFNIEKEKTAVNTIILEYPTGKRKITILVEPGDRLVNDQIVYMEKINREIQ